MSENFLRKKIRDILLNKKNIKLNEVSVMSYTLL